MKYLMIPLILFLGCVNEKKNTTMQVIEDFNKEIAIDKQLTYAVSVTTYMPYELYINDIAAEKDYDAGSNAAIEINPYLLGNGTHTIRLRLLPQSDQTIIDVDDYKMSHFELVKVVKNNKTGRGLKSSEEVLKLLLPPMPTALPFVEMQWEVKIDDLPYQLEGWSKSKVFKKKDSVEVMKQVVSYYEELRKILNEGDVVEWKKRITKERSDIWTVTYEKQSNYNENWDSILKEVKEECKGNMLPLENYELKFYAGGRVLSLERKETDFFQDIEVNIKGWNALILDDEGSVYSIETKLHMPFGSDAFEVIR